MEKRKKELREYILAVERRRDPADPPETVRFSYAAKTAGDTVATALLSINAREEIRDTDGAIREPVRWECSCLQKKCGACAMLINGKPMLACDAPLARLPKEIALAPLRKFPVVADLIVDRSIMRKNLADLRNWLDGGAKLKEKTAETAYAASRCLQCGLCLEVCPNYYAGGAFTGAASAVPAARVLTAEPHAAETETAALYEKHVFEGCGKSLACADVCPAGIDIAEMMARANIPSVWKRILGKRKKG